jgi:eukaryotic-like serine/threonine-protein kinase
VGGLDSFVGMDLSGTYRVVRQIARGGMGAIYEATHLRLPGKRYAIKVLAPRHAQNPELLLRFRQEAEIASRLGHEHIVDVHDFNFAGDLAFLVMELLDGEDLAARIARVGPLAPALVHHLVVQVTSALDAAHRARIVHRDLKPQNIFLCRRDGRDDYVKVLDFGISKVLDSVTIGTQNDIILGTPFYMAPEQAQGRVGEIDPRVDVFALGAILWEALTGKVAFDAPTLSAALYKVCLFDPPDVHVVRPELPPALSAVLRRALAKQREARTPGVVELACEFSAALGLAPPARHLPPAGAPPAGSPGPLAQAPTIAPSSGGTVASLPPSPPPSSLYLSASPQVPVRAGAGAGRPPASDPVSPDPARLLAWTPSASNRGSAVVAPPPELPDGREVPSRDAGSVVVPRSRRGAVIALCVGGAAATLAVVTAFVVSAARTPSAAARAGQHGPPTTQPVVPPVAAPQIVAPSATPAPAPPAVAPASTEISLVFEVAPPDAATSLQLDGVAVVDRRAHRPASPKHIVVTASARGFLPFRSELIADHDQIVAVALRRAPAKVVRPAARPGRGSPAAASPAAAAPPATHPAPEVPPPPAHGVASTPAAPEAVPAARPSPPISQPQPVQPQPVPVQPQPVPVQPQPVPPPTAKKTGTIFDQ